jgi:pimeloyl-ACP methyl ester carboxylesterase
MPYAKLEQDQIYYEIDGEGENLLLIHGVTSFLPKWVYMRPILRKHFRLILPELRGHGRSTKLTDTTDIQTLTQDIIGLLDDLSIDQCYVAGHSLGGFVAQQLALDAPDRVRALILICTGHKIDSELVMEWVKAGQAVYGLEPKEAVEKELETYYFDPEKIRQTPGLIELLIEDKAQHQALEQSHGFAQGAAVKFDVEGRLGEISAPTLVVQCARDSLFGLRFGEHLRDNIPNAQFLVINETDHSIQVEQPITLSNAIIEFFQSL